MGIFGGGYSETKIKPMLKMAVSRFNMASNKKSALMKQQMREISKLLAEDPPKEEKARIRAEALIRDDGTIEAYEILQLTCDLLFERIKLISTSKGCPEDLKSSVATLIWASDRVDIKELGDIRKQFRAKYGKQFDKDAFENAKSICNERVVAKLSVQPPTAFLVQTYLEKIADQHGVDWKPQNPIKAENMAEPMAAPVGYSVQVAPGSGLVVPVAMTVPAPPPETAPVPPMVPMPPATQSGRSSVGMNDNVSELGSVGAGSTASVAATAMVRDEDEEEDDTNTDNDEKKKKNKYGEIPIATAEIVSDIPPPAPSDGADIYIPPAPGQGGDSKPSADDFDELQSRFNNLKR